MTRVFGNASDGRAWLLLIVVAAAVLRFGVADHSLWFDEQAAAFFSDQPFSRLWSDWMVRETNPALYYSALRVWRMVFGSSDFAIRALSVVGSLASIPLAFRLVRRVYGERAGLFATALAALSGQQLYFAEQARSYIFVLCAALVAIDALLTFCVSRSGRERRWAMVAYAIAATIAIYLHTTMLLFPAIAFAAVIAADPRRYGRAPSLLLPLLVADVAILLGSGWAIRHAALQILGHGDNIAPVGLADGRLIAVYAAQTLFLSGYAGKTGYGIALLIALLATVFVVLDWKRMETRFLAAVGVLGLLCFGVIGMVVPVLVPRTIFWISAVSLVLTAAALARIPVARWRWGAFAVLGILLAFDTGRVAARLQPEDWDTPVYRIAQQPGALLLVQGEAMAVLADGACRRQLRRGICPYQIVAVTDPGDRFDSWATGAFTGLMLPVTELPDRMAGRTVFLFRKADYHNLPDLLHRRGLGHGVPAGGPPLIGPLPGTALR